MYHNFKKLVLLCVIVCVNINADVITKDMTKAELQQIEIKTLEECKKEFNIDDDLYRKFFTSSSEVTPTRDLKCMMNRYAEKMGFLKNNKTDWETIIAIEKIYHDNEEDRNKAIQAVEICKKNVIEQADICETSFEVGKCLLEEYRKACVGGCPTAGNL